jgi:hypothetical protein
MADQGQNIGEKPEGKETFKRHGCRGGGDNIKTDLKLYKFNNVEWIHLLRIRTRGCSCDHGKARMRYIKDG